MYNKEVKLSGSTLNGYQYFYDPKHPLAISDGIVYYHRHVMSVNIGRWLSSDEYVHHVNGDKSDNRIENLEITSIKEHMSLHAVEKIMVECKICGVLTDNKNCCSVECYSIYRRIVERPSKNDLEKMIEEKSWVQIGRDFGVSDNAVRKWARSYGLL